MKTEILEMSLLEHNTGQVPKVPANPRLIDEGMFELLKDSIKRSPEYLHVRPLIVYPFKGKYVVMSGNMRMEACIALGLDKVPCKILPEDTTPRKMRAYITKDNLAFGSDDPEGMKAFTKEELDFVGKGFYLQAGVNIEDLFEDAKKSIEIKISIPTDKKDLKGEMKAELERQLKTFDNIKVK